MLNISSNYVKYIPSQVAFKGNRNNTYAGQTNYGMYDDVYHYNVVRLSRYIDGLNKEKYSLETKRPNLLSHTNIDYQNWLNQFETRQEKVLALKMLENYLYIDIDNARKGFRKLYHDLENEIDMNETNFAVFGAAKSGSFMGYLFRQANKLRSKGHAEHEYSPKDDFEKREKFLTCSQLADVEFNKQQRANGIKNIVIVDDILGDGDSFCEYMTPEVQDSLMQYENIYYITLVKDPEGEERLKNRYPYLNINFKSAQEILKYDSKENDAFSDIEKCQIATMLKKYGKKINPELVDKYSRSKLLVGFEWNNPGNSPMIFNVTNANWDGLFSRFNGLEEADVGTKFDFYG